MKCGFIKLSEEKINIFLILDYIETVDVFVNIINKTQI